MKCIYILPIAIGLLVSCSHTPTVNQYIDSTQSSFSSTLASQIHNENSLSTSVQKNPLPLIDYTIFTNEDWKKVLTKEQYHILREAGTERPFTSSLLNEHRAGTYISADCKLPVFRSEQKFDSGTGWPSFYAPITPNAVQEKTDTTLGITRTEIVSPCGGHLGHVFDDGPAPTGLRYCMNGDALLFVPDEKQ